MAGGFFNQFLKEIQTGDEIHDWQHASRTFVDSLYRLSPKIGTVYHVFMDLNPVVATTQTNEQIEIGMMAKSVALPKFSISTKTWNWYPRQGGATKLKTIFQSWMDPRCRISGSTMIILTSN